MKERIIEEAAKLFKTYGIRSVTMDQIASQLGISKRTLYELFADKEQLLESVLMLMADRQKEMVSRILEGSETAIHAIFKLLENSKDHIRDMSPAFQSDLRKYHFQLMMNKTLKNELPEYRSNIKLIERGIQENLFRKDINPDIVNRCLYSVARSAMDFELYPPEEFTRSEVLKNVFINYLRGISTPEGADLINQLEMKF